MHVQSHHALDELETLAANTRDAKMHIKLRAIVLAHKGWTSLEIAEALGCSVRTVQQWVHDYNGQGLDGLKDTRGGNHRYLQAAQEQELKTHLDQQASDPHQGVRHAGELISWIQQRFGVVYSLTGLYALLHRLGYSWLMPRPRHPQSDPAAQEDFKKTPPRWCRRSRISIPTRLLKSGSRMKHALASRAR